MNIKKPMPLQPGQGIGIVALSSPLIGNKLERYQSGLQYLVERGHPVVEAENVRTKAGYLAGTDAERVDALQSMLINPDVGAIICSRGGYGTPRILQAIDYQLFRKHPKILTGYSDFTALQLALFRKSGLVTFSGPMVASEMHGGMSGVNAESFWNMLYGKAPVSIPFAQLGRPVRIYQQGQAQGRLLGGCFSVLCSLLATPYCPDFKGSILLLEDIGEDLYRIDRMFAQLQLTGVLQRINGLILGDFPDCFDKISDEPTSLNDIVLHYTKDLSIPVIGNVHYGHDELKHTFPLGIRVGLDTLKSELKYLESAVHA